MITPEVPLLCGGIGYYVFYLARELISLGLSVKILVRSHTAGRMQYQGVSAECVPVKGIPPFNNGLFRRGIEAFASEWQPDIIHVHASSMPVLKSGVPIVVTSHCNIKANTHLFYRPIRGFEALYRNIFFPFYTLVEHRLVTSCNRLTVVSPSMAEDYRQFYGVDSEVVWNGVDTDHFRPYPKTSVERTIVFVGALKRGKGVLDLLGAARLAQKQRAEGNFTLYGDGPLREILEKKTRAYGLRNFRLAGSINHSELPQILGNAAVFVLPSYYEGLPNTLLEAMACGTPVIATDIKGNADLIENRITGYLIPPADPKALYSAILNVIAHREVCSKMGEYARKLVLKSFQWSNVGQRFINAYEHVLK